MAPERPQFPDGLRETSLQRLPLSGLLNRDSEVEDHLFEACKSHGFFLLDLTESTQGKSLMASADRLQELAAEAFKLPIEEKQKIAFDKTGCLFGWKPSGAVDKADKFQRKDVGQFFNIPKDGVLGNPGHKDISFPSPLKEEIEQTGLLKNFMQEAHGTAGLVLGCLERKLGLPRDVLVSRHRISELSGDHCRLTYGPGDPNATGSCGFDEESTRITTAQHTDFGTVTILFNWLGGLQLENRDKGGWEWVRPVPGHAIVNLGDAMVEFGGKQLRSGKHRVVAAPGEQARLERYSVVYFMRPEDEVYLENLTEKTSTNGSIEADLTSKRWKAGEWIMYRAQNIGNKFSDVEAKA